MATLSFYIAHSVAYVHRFRSKAERVNRMERKSERSAAREVGGGGESGEGKLLRITNIKYFCCIRYASHVQ